MELEIYRLREGDFEITVWQIDHCFVLKTNEDQTPDTEFDSPIKAIAAADLLLQRGPAATIPVEQDPPVDHLRLVQLDPMSLTSRCCGGNTY